MGSGNYLGGKELTVKEVIHIINDERNQGRCAAGGRVWGGERYGSGGGSDSSTGLFGKICGLLALAYFVYLGLVLDGVVHSRENKVSTANSSSNQRPVTIQPPPSQLTENLGSWSGTLVASGLNKHGYVVTPIDTRRYPEGGVLHLEISVGTGVAAASFDLFQWGVRLPTEGMPNQQGSLASAWNVQRGGMAEINYRFQRGDLFEFGAEGSWQSPVGATNSYTVRASVSR
jgi:hypothetical protein